MSSLQDALAKVREVFAAGDPVRAEIGNILLAYNADEIDAPDSIELLGRLDVMPGVAPDVLVALVDVALTASTALHMLNAPHPHQKMLQKAGTAALARLAKVLEVTP